MNVTIVQIYFVALFSIPHLGGVSIIINHCEATCFVIVLPLPKPVLLHIIATGVAKDVEEGRACIADRSLC